MIWIQLLGAIFALDMIFITYFYHKRRVFFLHDTIIWMSIWMGILLSVLFPDTLDVIVEPLQFIRVLDFMAVAGFFLIFSLLFTVFTRMRNNDKRIEELVRTLALREAEE